MEVLKLRSELLRCVSSKISNKFNHKEKAVNKSVRYPESCRKQFQQCEVSNSKPQDRVIHNKTTGCPTKSQHQRQKCIEGLPVNKVTLHKTSSGYGFTVKNTRPVRVGRVRPEGAAQLSGLRKGDFVLRLNGQDAHQMSAQSVARVVRHSPKSLDVEFCRKPSRAPPCGRCQDSVPILETAHIYNTISGDETDSGVIQSLSRSSLEIPDGFYQSIGSSQRSMKEHCSGTNLSHSRSMMEIPDGCENEENIAPTSFASRSRSNFLKLSQSGKDSSTFYQTSSFGSKSCITRIKDNNSSTPNQFPSVSTMKSARSYTKWEPDISVISTAESLNNRRVISFCDFKDHESRICSKRTRTESDSMKISSQALRDHDAPIFSSSHIRSNTSIDSPSTLEHHSKDSVNLAHSTHFNPSNSSKTLDSSLQAPHCSLADSYHDNPSLCPELRQSPSYHDNPSPCPSLRQAAVRRLCDLESEFSQMMQLGVQQFSRPLRHCVLSAQQHASLFQNVEKLVTLSEYHLHQLKISQSLEGSSPDLLGEVYKPRIKLLCSAYKSYLEGLPVALSLMFELQNSPAFVTFIQKQQSSLVSLDAFVRRPWLHLAALTQTISAVREQTPQSHRDHRTLGEIIEALNSVNPPTSELHFPQSHPDAVLEMFPLPALTQCCPPAPAPPCSTDDLSVTSTDSAFSTSSHGDSRVLDLQNRLTFGSGVKPFRLSDSSRHLILEGSLLTFSAGSWIPLQAALMSDMLLLTTVTNDDRLQIYKQPISLLDVLSVTASDSDARELTLTVERLSRGPSLRCYAERLHLRAASVEDKAAWRSVLQHRVDVLKRQANCRQHVL